jgi:hypothetical protein
MSDAKSLIQSAEAHFRATLVTYPTWKKRVAQGYYRDPANTEWGAGFKDLAEAERLLSTSPVYPSANLFPRQ